VTIYKPRVVSKSPVQSDEPLMFNLCRELGKPMRITKQKRVLSDPLT
jgi:hypothetical protein